MTTKGDNDDDAATVLFHDLLPTRKERKREAAPNRTCRAHPQHRLTTKMTRERQKADTLIHTERERVAEEEGRVGRTR